MLNTHFDKERLIIITNESGGIGEYNYQFFKKDFEEWGKSGDLKLANIHHLKEYLIECGYKIIDIKEE